MNYYRRYVGDYLRDTSRLSMLEHGAYNLLLDYYYADEQPLPLDHQELYTMVRAMRPEDRKAVEKILGMYFTRQPDGYHQKRVDHEIAVSKKARDNGKGGGRPKTERQPGFDPDWYEKAPFIETGTITGLQTELETEEQTGIETGTITGDGGGSVHPPTTNHQPPAASLQPPTTRGKPERQSQRSQKGSRLSLETIPIPWERWCNGYNKDLNAILIFDVFKDYWISQPGQKGVKVDWFATWRNWVRREGQNGKGASAGKGDDLYQRNLRAVGL